MKKFNLALLPITTSEQYITISQTFAFLKTEYQLGEKSLPHVTICQFYAEESEIDTIWESIDDSIKENTIELEFDKFSCISFDNKTFFISLLPNDASELFKLRSELACYTKESIHKPYDPHMTLISTSDSSYEIKADSLIKKNITVSDRFILALGLSDEIGQFIEIVKQIDLSDSFKYIR